MPNLDEAIARAAAAPMLLVASDFDGTLSELAPRPELARANPDGIAALTVLAQMRQTHGAVVSGRELEALRELVGKIDRLHLVGSHGGQVEDMPPTPVSPEVRATLEEVRAEAERHQSCTPGIVVERKPMGVAFHYRGADDAGARCAKELSAFAEARPGLRILHGKMVLEVIPDGIDKSKAVAAMRRRAGATCVVYVGDDETDENVFRSLQPGDVSIKVGEGETAAAYRVRNVEDVVSVFTRIGDVRLAGLAERRPPDIANHSMLSDQRTIALVNDLASISWLCLPRVDSPPIFWSLLDEPQRASFDIQPAVGFAKPTQHYLRDSFILVSDFGAFKVTDYFDCTGGRAYQRAGRTDLVRLIEGTGKIKVRFAPRFDFGRTPTTLQLKDGGLAIAGWVDPLVLYAPGISWELREEGKHHVAHAEIELVNSRAILELRYGAAGLKPSPTAEPEQQAMTERFWTGWAKALRLPGVGDRLVTRSALVIKALWHGPSGAIAAAGTTSLPAPIGGARNWDYRYCWPRDSALAAAALTRLGNTGGAIRLLDWLVGVVERIESPDRLRPIYTVGGGNLGSEAELTEVAGYADSKPVRISNAAAHQTQLDIFGPIVDLVALLLENDAPVTPAYWDLVQSMVGAVALRWEEPDHGIWEIRDFRRQWVYSKAMCWHAVDRAITVAELMQAETRRDWIDLRQRIADDVLTKGFDPKRGIFTSAYGCDDLDAAVLQIGLLGLVQPTDPRFIATVEAIEKELVVNGHVLRYVLDDQLPGLEGAFHICTAWLAESLARMGRIDDAERYFTSLADCAGKTGLMSEQIDPRTQDSMGNFPQAYSHLGLINAAVAIANARRATPPR